MLRKLLTTRKDRHRPASGATSRGKNERLLVEHVLTTPGVRGEYLFDALLRIFDVDKTERESAAIKFLDVTTDLNVDNTKLFLKALEIDSMLVEERPKLSVDTLYTFISDQNLLHD